MPMRAPKQSVRVLRDGKTIDVKTTLAAKPTTTSP